jgi:molybdopterin-guanine dinucleotide biosynthesis protein A
MTKRPCPVTTVILAGGLGRRIGGNKGLQMLQGRALISWVLSRVSSDSQEVLINVNGAQAPYAHFGCRLVSDLIPGWQGPLAGIHAALDCAETEYVMAVPCDTPFLPENLIARLFAAIKNTENEAAVAVAGGHRQPAIALFSKKVLPKLAAFLAADRRKVNDWLNTLRLSEVIFDNADDFENINSPQDLARAEQRVAIQSANNAG